MPVKQYRFHRDGFLQGRLQGGKLRIESGHVNVFQLLQRHYIGVLVQGKKTPPEIPKFVRRQRPLRLSQRGGIRNGFLKAGYFVLIIVFDKYLLHARSNVRRPKESGDDIGRVSPTPAFSQPLKEKSG